jgi:hypothetical protein
MASTPGTLRALSQPGRSDERPNLDPGLGNDSAIARCRVELRGLEPQPLPAKTRSEMRLLAPGVVTPCGIFLRICGGVLRDVTVLALLPGVSCVSNVQVAGGYSSNLSHCVVCGLASCAAFRSQIRSHDTPPTTAISRRRDLQPAKLSGHRSLSEAPRYARASPSVECSSYRGANPRRRPESSCAPLELVLQNCNGTRWLLADVSARIPVGAGVSDSARHNPDYANGGRRANRRVSR